MTNTPSCITHNSIIDIILTDSNMAFYSNIPLLDNRQVNLFYTMQLNFLLHTTKKCNRWKNAIYECCINYINISM